MSLPAFPDLRARMLVALMLPLFCILLGSAYVDFRVAKETANLAHDQSLADAAYDLEGYLQERAVAAPDLRKEAAAIARSFQPDQFFYAIATAGGEFLAGAADLPGLPARAARPAAASAAVFYDADYRGQRLRLARLSVELQGQQRLITVAETRLRRQQSQQSILAAMFWPNVVVIALCLLAVLFGVRQGLAPLRTMAEEIAARSVDDLREIELGETPREVRSLVERLNTLFAKLRQAAQVQQRFIADAAHQLRTPLAALQHQLDLAVATRDFGQQGERLAQIEQASSRIGHLLTQLLAYAQAEATSQLRFAPVALPELLEEAASHFLDAALAKQIDLGFEVAPAVVHGQAWLLQEALGNLIDNAIRYTPAGGVITVRCGASDDAAFLEVEDSGPGIAEAYREQVFERFYRLPGNQENGCGLGLSIVGEIASRHRAQLRLSQGASLGGLTVRLDFPRSAPPRPAD